jgi:hypothetical protein
MTSNQDHKKAHDIDLSRELKTNISSLNSTLYSTAVSVNQIKEMSTILKSQAAFNAGAASKESLVADNFFL